MSASLMLFPKLRFPTCSSLRILVCMSWRTWNCSRSAVSPNKVFDYMASGLPVLTNCPGSVTHLVLEAKAGRACEPTSLGDALINSARDPAVLDRSLGDSGRSWIRLSQSRIAMSVRLQSLLDLVR